MLTEESRAMSLAHRLGMEQLAWALRRLHCPVPPDALVLEVGSGGNPGKKRAAVVDGDLVELYEDRVKPILTGETIRRHPFAFHVRHYWENQIAFAVVNPGVDAGWPAPAGKERPIEATAAAGLRAAVASLLRTFFSQRRRNATIDLLSLLRRPACEGEALHRGTAAITCTTCGVAYPVREGRPHLFAPKNERSV